MSIPCRLTAAAESGLVIARSTAIEVYALSVTAGSAAGAGKGRSAPLDGVCGAQLELLTRSELFGVVESLRAVLPACRERRLPFCPHCSLSSPGADSRVLRPGRHESYTHAEPELEPAPEPEPEPEPDSDQVRLPGAAHDTLLVAFSDAKLALLEHDP